MTAAKVIQVLGRKRLSVAVALVLASNPDAHADLNEWSAAPATWTEGLSVDAFCEPGEWFFESFGDRARGRAVSAEDVRRREQAAHALSSPQSEVTFGADWLLVAIGDRAASWLPDGPRADEMTHLRISRDSGGALAIEAYAGDIRAAWRVYGPKDSSCAPGKSLRIDVADTLHRQGTTSLALANDGSLIVRNDSFDEFFWPLTLVPVGGFFARFPPADVASQPQVPVN